MIWRWISFRHLFHEGGRTLLTLLGVALGVAVFVSIRLANHSAMAAFADTVDAVTGKASMQVVGDSAGFDERIYPEVLAVPGVKAAAPVVQAYAPVRIGRRDGYRNAYVKGERDPFNETLLVLGVDLFSEGPFARFEAPELAERLDGVGFLTDARGAAITRALADRWRLKEGDELHLLAGGRPETLNVRLILDSQELQQAMGGNVVVTDIAAAQEIFRRCGKLDRIDLLVDPGDRASVEAALRRLLPPGVRAAQPQTRTKQVENMVSAFALNLTALSFIALFVSMFLIFNSVSMSVLRRRREIGILRGLGQTRRRVLTQFLSESAFLGIVGSLLGLGLGTLLAKLTLGSVARTLTTLYLVVNARNVVPDPVTYAVGFGLGLGVSLLSALAPAVEASQTPPGVTMRQGNIIEAQPLPIRQWTWTGAGILLLAAAVTWWTVGQQKPLGGFVSAFLLLVGFSMLAPGFTLFCENVLLPVMRGAAGIEGMLGARYLREAVARTSVVVGALMVSVGMMVALSIMVGSFRRTVSVWVNQTLRGDLYVEPVGRSAAGSATVLLPEIVEAARSLPGVAAVDTYRGVQITYHNRIASVIGIDFAVQERFGRLQFMNGRADEVLRRARAGGGVIVTESFAFRHHVRVGDRVDLDTPTGVHPLPVSGIFYDYSTDAGALMLDYPLYERLWNDRRTESLALYLRPGADVEKVRQQFIRAVNGRMVLYVTPNQALRRRVLTVFDQTFQITYALQAIAMLVAVMGVVSTLTALILQRGREIAVLRAVGALRRQVQKMVLVESGLIGLIGALLGCVCGLALALLLTYVINKQFFGWTIRFTLDPWLFVQAVLMMTLTAVLAGLGPARLAAGRVAAEAMRLD